MKLTVKNFGPIREAKNIDISPLTIFVGPSNTGKSYLAMLVYSILKMFANEEFSWKISHQTKGNSEPVRDLIKSQKTISAEIQTYFSQWAQAISVEWRHHFAYCFGEETRNAIEGRRSNQGFSVVISDPENKLFLDLTSPKNSRITSLKRREFSKHIKKELSKPLVKKFENENLTFIDFGMPTATYEEINNNILLGKFQEAILQKFQTSLLAGWQTESLVEAYYLPAVRGGIMQSHRTLVSALIEHAPMAGLSRTSPVPLFNGVLSDFMKKLINVEARKLRKKRTRFRRISKHLYSNDFVNSSDSQKIMQKLGRSMERRILSGEIGIQRSQTRYPDFRYKFEGGDGDYDLPLMSASSSVSELAPVSLFIRYYVHPGDLFIVEEPEAHLHPSAQREISDILVQLVNAGVNALITTHSDNILEQITNFIYAADVPDSKKTKLDKEKCSVYLFRSSGKIKKTIVKKIPFDSETGLLTQDHLDVSSALYNETVDLIEKRENAGS